MARLDLSSILLALIIVVMLFIIVFLSLIKCGKTLSAGLAKSETIICSELTESSISSSVK